MATPPIVPYRQQLIDLINKDNGTNLRLQDVVLSPPTPVSQNGRNTKVVVSSVAGSGYAGSQDIYYNRISMSKLGYVGVLTDAPLTTSELLTMINAQKKIDLLAEDFQQILMPVLEVGDVGMITLRTKADAIKWWGETQVEIAFGIPDNIDLLHQFVNFTLPSPGYLT